MILTTPNQIEAYRQRVLQKMLRLEILGMKRRGQSAYAIIKAEFSLKGSKQKVYDQLTELLNKEKLQSKIAPTFSVDGGEPMI